MIMTTKPNLPMNAVALFSFTSVAALLVGTSFSDDTVTKSPKRVEPLILELKLQAGPPLRQEILVSEGKEFRVITHRNQERWVVEGDVEPIVDGVTVVNLRVSMYGPHPGSSANFGPMKMKQKVNEFKGGGFGSSHANISDLWIRRGPDVIPPLTKQLSAKPERAVAAAQYLENLGADAKAALPALQKAAENDNAMIKIAARKAIQHIRGHVGSKGN